MVRRLRRGFTLVELLVVIAIIGMLAALLLPAVQAARESGRRTVCLNNMSQLSLAAFTFDTNRGRFPGWHEVVGNKNASWAVVMLPNMDNQGLYDLWSDSTISIADGRLYPFIPSLVCPSAANKMSNKGFPENSYVANAGFLPRPTVDPAFPPNVYLPPPAAEGTADGVFVNSVPFYDAQNNLLLAASRVSSADLTNDGITNTILFSEHLLAAYWPKADLNTKYPNSAAPFYPAGVTVMCWLYASDDAPTFNVWPVDTTPPGPLPAPTVTTPDMKINFGKRTLLGWDQLMVEHVRPSSNHPGIVLMSFADKHVVPVREGIEYRVYQQLLTTNSPRSHAPHRQFPLREADYQ